eukprot:TRINITY_DN1768_c0_g2_i1.p1 TRINITY_DN1768_c0_g2~~TRINITY_DN1768_c0_g2_i1.p1  ORF type:complete len:534 (-),score=207.60 TRINITY_DN1768_c0_g2_i1:417-2018(-)
MDTEAELEDLKRKFQLLEGDRKVHYETTQATIKENKEKIIAAKKEHKSLTAAVADARREQGARATKSLQEAELRSAEAKLLSLKAQRDTIMFERQRKEKELQQLRDKLTVVEREAESKEQFDTPDARKIRMLENRLDKAMIKFNEAQSIRKTYEQIVKRLKEERIGFDNQLAAIERTLKAKERDYEELLLMSHDAQHAREHARAELATYRSSVEEMRAAREKELSERKQYVQTRVEATKRMEQREKQRHESEQKTKTDLDRDGEKDLKTRHAAEHFKQEGLEARVKREEEQISKYEEMFRRIKEATGVSDVNEVIQKFLTQDDTQKNLEEMISDAQAKIEELNEEKGDLKTKLEELKYLGSGAVGSRRIVDDFEANLSEATALSERNRQKYERVAKLLINVKAGIEHLREKLEPIRLEVEEVPLRDETVVEVLAQCEQKLMFLKEKIAGGGEETDGGTVLESMDPGDVELPEHNVRIALPVDPEEGEDEEGYAESGDEDDVMNRETVKKLSAIAVEKATKKPRKRKGKKSGTE